MAAPFDPHPQFQEYAHPERLVSASWLSARLGTPGLLWLAVGVLWLEIEFEVVGPPELVEFVEDLVGRLVRSAPTG